MTVLLAENKCPNLVVVGRKSSKIFLVINRIAVVGNCVKLPFPVAICVIRLVMMGLARQKKSVCKNV